MSYKKQFIFLILLLLLFSISLSSASISSNVWNNVSYDDYNVTDAEYGIGVNASLLTIALGGVDDGVAINENNSSTYPVTLLMGLLGYNSINVVNGETGSESNMQYVNGSMVFGGTNSHIAYSNNASYKPANFSILFEMTTSDKSNQVIFESDYTTGYSVQMDPDGTIKLNIGNIEVLTTTSNHADGLSHWYLINYESGGNRSIFVDNTLKSFLTSSPTPVYSTGNIYVGGRATVAPLEATVDALYLIDGYTSNCNSKYIQTGYSGTSAKLGENGEWQPVINCTVTFENATAGQKVYLLSADDSVIATPATFSSSIDTTDTIISENYDGYNVTINATSYTEFPITNGTLIITTNQSALSCELLNTNNPNASVSVSGGNFIVDTGYVPADTTYYYEVSAAYSLVAGAIDIEPDIDHAHYTWTAIPEADNYTIQILNGTIMYIGNWTELGIDIPVLDGNLDWDVANYSQQGILRSPNPANWSDYDRLFGVYDDDNFYVGAITKDNDNDPNDDRLGFYIDFLRDGLTSDDVGYVLKEDGTFTRYRWSGSAWIAYGGSGASFAVGGAGTSEVTYEFEIPLTELVGFTMGNYIDLVARRTSTFGGTVYSFFPYGADTILSTDNWQTLFLDDESTSLVAVEYTTTDTYYNVTNLRPYTWYRSVFFASSGGVDGETTQLDFVTLDYPTYVISGTVYDYYTGNPVPFAGITVNDTFVSAYRLCDSNGNFSIENLHNDDYTLIATHEYYGEGSLYVIVNGYNITDQEIIMYPDASGEITLISTYNLLIVVLVACFYMSFPPRGQLIQRDTGVINWLCALFGMVISRILASTAIDGTLSIDGYFTVYSSTQSYLFSFVTFVFLILFVLDLKMYLEQRHGDKDA